jgi:anti-anti-sigma factor
MEISKRQLGDVVEISIKGRLDNYWSEYLAKSLNIVVNDGAHHLRLDLSEVNFLSSAGIGVLARIYQQLRAIQGTFVIGKASERVRSTLRLVALEPILFETARPAVAVRAASPARTLELDQAIVDVYTLPGAGTMRCRLIGDPGLIYAGNVSAVHCQTRPFSDSSLALGIGALGADYEDCRSRFGEFVAIGGCCASLPTDATSVPDYLVSVEKFVPEVQVLCGIECHGTPAQLLRFECRQDARLSLYEVAKQCLDVAGGTSVAIAILAEASKVVGAALNSSPAEAPPRLDFPQIRDSFSFLPATAGARTTVACAGIASRDPWPALVPFLRRLDPDSGLVGHFHAALFPYRPLQRGFLELVATAHTMFESQVVSSVLHLLNDVRPITGVGDTAFARGACWIAPLSADGGVVQ